MNANGIERERVMDAARYSTRGATVPRVLFTGWIAAAARVGGTGNAARGASPTADKREGISF